MALKHIFLIPTLVLVLGCDSKLSVKDFSQLVASSLSCDNFETQMFDSLLLALDQDQELPTPEELKKQLYLDFQNINEYEKHKIIVDEILIKFIQFYSDIYKNHPVSFNEDAITNIKKYLMAIETRDTSDLNQFNFIKEYKLQLDSIQLSAKKLKQDCVTDEEPTPPPLEKGTLFEYLKSNHTKEVYGAYKTFSTAYQNCEASQLSALNSQTKNLEGVKVIGRHKSGGGNLRVIASLRDVQKTHPYISERSPSNTCFNTYANPLIYDYGGKPKTVDTKDSDLNFFENDGSGTKALGTDCSGFVFSSLASGGLKLNPEVTVKARQILSYGAARFVDPVKSGVTCFQKVVIDKTSTIKPGDIVASSGHIFIITKSSSDPLGTEKAKSINDCASISEKNFDFEIMQSSPSLGAIGINKMKASDYLATSSTMRKITIEFAKKLCQSKFNGQSYVQTSKEASIVRHKRTPECLSSLEIKLARESCVSDCRVK